MPTLYTLFNILILLLSLSFHTSTNSQPQPQPSTSDVCNGILISYAYSAGYALPPNISSSDPARQPYRFESNLTVLNNGLEELKSWRVFVGFQNGVSLVSASQAVLADGTSLPADVSNGTAFAGFPVTDLKSAVQTAGDFNQMQAQVQLVGVQFGLGPPAVPMPTTISLANDGFLCSSLPNQGNNVMRVCCTKDPSARSNITLDEEFLPRRDGDLIIMYDVLRAYETSYHAQVTISSHNPIGRLDNWHLSWDWMRHEFINTMRGAYPYVVDSNDCIFGTQGQFYKDLDFAKVLNCEKTPTIIDLPLEKTNDTDLGMVPFCCRNGTILPSSMDPKRSTSSFQMEVYKMPPDLNRTRLNPPQNWKINGTLLNPDYQCGPPFRVSPSMFPDPRGLLSETSAVASWQLVCNMTQLKSERPKCCVSFSAFYNDSVIPCNTCACGCDANPSNICSATAPPLLLPSEALLVPFENRTKMALDFADLKRRKVPNPLPCGDNCGVSINWHLLTDYKSGWTARMTLFNWGGTDFVDWFAAVELDKGFPGFEKAFSFNGSTISGSNNTIFVHGLEDFNYLVKERDGKNPRKDPRLPGTQQSVITFTKKKTPGINVAGGDGFPTKVYFNGEECSLPSIIPNNGHGIGAATTVFSFLLALPVLVFLQH